jgi:murein DD-endopeptidase MepM/ murein hydrolase activator NlpD
MGGTFFRRLSFVRKLKILAAILLAVNCWAAESKSTDPNAKAVAIWSVQWQPALLVNGSPVLFQVKSPSRLKSLSGKWLEHDISFALNPKSKNWNVIAGIGLSVKPGVYTLSLNGMTPSGKDVSFERRVSVGAGKYRTTTITVESKYTAPSPEQLEIINRDKQIKQETFKKVSSDREWAGVFKPPLDAPFSDIFGTQRTFNGQVRSVHEGLDFAAVAGTPVTALNSGTVLLARPLYFEGNCVVLDHGQGLLTLYLHLSEFKVKEGDKVERGQELGLVGGTGRASGPHLHIAVRWQGVYLDPATLLKMKLP